MQLTLGLLLGLAVAIGASYAVSHHLIDVARVWLARWFPSLHPNVTPPAQVNVEHTVSGETPRIPATIVMSVDASQAHAALDDLSTHAAAVVEQLSTAAVAAAPTPVPAVEQVKPVLQLVVDQAPAAEAPVVDRAAPVPATPEQSAAAPAPIVPNDPRLAGFDPTKPIVRDVRFAGYDTAKDPSTGLTMAQYDAAAAAAVYNRVIDWAKVDVKEAQALIDAGGTAPDGSRLNCWLGGLKAKAVAGVALTDTELVAAALQGAGGILGLNGVCIAPVGNPNVPAELAGRLAWFMPAAHWMDKTGVVRVGGWQPVSDAVANGNIAADLQ